MTIVVMSNANPDFFRTEEVDLTAPGGRRTLIYSSLDELPVAQLIGGKEMAHQLPARHNVTIHALDVTLIGPIAVPGGDVRITCRTLRVLGDGTDDDQPGASLDVSAVRDATYAVPLVAPVLTSPASPPIAGKDGDAFAAEQPPFGTAGAGGGSITIVCDALVLAAPLILTADGARGYPGCDGQHGSPPSSDGTITAGAGGAGGAGGVGGAGGTIRVQYCSIDHPEHLICRAAPGESGEPGASGREGGQLRRRPGPPAAPTAPGVPGSVAELAIDRRTLGLQLDDVLMRRIVQHAKQLYMFDQPLQDQGSENGTWFPTNWDAQGKLLGWLVGVLDLGKDGGARKLQLYDEAYALWQNHRDKKTFDGWSPDWVPSSPLEVMIGNFDRSFAGRKAIEDTYHALAVGYADKQEQDAKLEEARLNAITVKANALARYEVLRDQLGTSLAPIQQAVAECDTAGAALKQVLATLAAAVGSHFDFSLSSLLKAIETTVFTVGQEAAQGIAMATTQIASPVNDGMTRITEDEGHDSSKAGLLHQIKTIGTSIRDAAQGNLYKLDDDGKPIIDPQHEAALAELQRFRDEIAKYHDTLGPDVVEPAVYGVERYTNAVTDKGKATVVFHILTRELLKAFDVYADARDDEAALADRKAALDPTSVGMVTHYAVLYQQQLESAMADYARLQRKYAYIKLTATPNDLAARGRELWTQGTKVSGQDLDRIREKVDGLQSELARWSADKPGATHKIPSDDKTMRSVLKVVIRGDGDGAPMLEELRRTGSLSFTTVRAGTQATPGKPWFVPIVNSDAYCEIRVTHVRPRLFGATTRSGNLLVKIRMSTWSEIYNDQGTRFRFTHHMPRTADFAHRPASIFDPNHEGDNGDTGMGGNGALTDTYLDTVGAFTRWTVWVPKTAGPDSINADCNLSNVTALVIYFTGAVVPTTKQSTRNR